MTRAEAIELVETAFEMWEHEWDTGDDWSKEHEARDMAVEALKSEPRIVRCKDCKWWLPPHGCNDTAGLIYTTANAFCSFAERWE